MAMTVIYLAQHYIQAETLVSRSLNTSSQSSCAMAVHKYQSQAFDYIGVDLTREVFGYGELCALSRVALRCAQSVALG